MYKRQIFVIARATDGSRVPIAVRRLTASQLPTEIRLTDQDSMVKTRSLTTFEEVEVIGRAAVGGTPVAKSGDFESKATIVEVGGRGTIFIGTVEIRTNKNEPRKSSNEQILVFLS